jgi:outer membrane protein assembly factor BamB
LLKHAFGLLCVILPGLPVAAQDSPLPPALDNPFLSRGTEDRGWPFVRGPNYDGYSPEIRIADQWPESGPPVLWTRDLGQGYSAFVAQGTRVYTQGQTLGGQYVYCLHADTGKTIWEHRYDWPYKGMGVYPGPRATPTLSDGRVYFSAPSGTIGCLNAETGREIWSRNVVADYKGRGGVDFGYACSPTVIDGLGILPVGGQSASMVALDADDGSEIWSSGSDSSSYVPAFPFVRGNRKLVAGYMENSLVLHDRRSGELLTRLNLSGGYDEHASWPIYQEPYLWLSGPFRSRSQLLQFSEQLGRNSELRIVWKDSIMSNDVVSSVLVDGHVYGFDIFDVQAKTQRPSRGIFRCIDLQTGEERWAEGTGRPNHRKNGGDPTNIGQAGIVIADGKLILLNERGELILLRATPVKCDELARTSVLSGELTWTPPVLNRGRVYVRNHSRAVCVYVGEPEFLDPGLATLSVADIPQAEYFDLAAAILTVEPEYMFDVPSNRWLFVWYGTSLAILACSGLLALGVSRCVRPNRRGITRRCVYVLTAFLAGAVGTTVLSALSREFIFTWPVCLFVAFEPVVATVRKRKPQDGQPGRPWAE